MKGKVLVFGGTTEGRVLADYLRKYEILHEVSVATEYGKEILLESGEKSPLVGRKNSDEIAALIKSEGFTFVVDATHPFATVASAEIRKACENIEVPYIRLKRDTKTKAFSSESVVFVDSIEDGILELRKSFGNILLFTGSKDLEKIANGLQDRTRLFARVLPNEESIGKCVHAGLSGRQIIAMQGPFSKEMNVATIKEINASVILTKESGKTGGFDEKIEAALECETAAVVIRNPESMAMENTGSGLVEVLNKISQHVGKEISIQKEITLAAAGPGGEAFHTAELSKYLSEADIIFGAEKVLENIKTTSAVLVPEYLGEKIYAYLAEHHGYQNPLVLFSGDISLCSGAKKATEFFRDKGYKVNRICGVSSVTLFAERLGLSLENCRVISAHGKECNVTGFVRQNREVIILASNAEHAKKMCAEILEIKEKNQATFDLKNSEIFRIKVGCDLGTSCEKLIDIGSDFSGGEFNICGKCLIYVKNPEAEKKPVVMSLSDDEIIREKTPMTKEEVRALSMRKLALTKDAVFYDVGAGTGSISLEAALLSPDIKVYSVEKSDNAVEPLESNKKHFCANNMEIIHGDAPKALMELPMPTHVFIGGSSGEMRDILKTVFGKNERARVVINTVTAESFAEVIDCAGDYPEIEPDIIQVSITRFKKAGRYHLADALNPVYVITLQKGMADD